MQRLLRGLVKPVLGLSVSLAMLGLMEGGLWLAGVPAPGLYEGDLSVVWWLRPELDTTQRLVEEARTFTVKTDARGLRGPLAPPESAPWTLALGCSTTFGWGVEAEEAWPALLAAQTGQAIINGGTPGWSTHQARLGAQRWLDLKPDRVILGYIVRDAQPALRQDIHSTPTPLLLRSHLGRLLRSGLASPAPAGPAPDLPTVRVTPEDYRSNLDALVEMAGDAEIVLLAFPQQTPMTAWRAVLEALPHPLIAPELPSEAFFANDPIHLTPAGNQALAAQLAADPALQSTPPPRR